MTDVKVEGLAEFERNLDALVDRMTAVQVLRRVARAGVMPITVAAKANATAVKESGAMAAAIGTATRVGNNTRAFGTGAQLSSSTAVFAATVTRNRSKKALALYNAHHRLAKPVRRLRHFHLVEFGHKGLHGGGAAKRPMTRAFDAKKRAALDAVARAARLELDKLRLPE